MSKKCTKKTNHYANIKTQIPKLTLLFLLQTQINYPTNLEKLHFQRSPIHRENQDSEKKSMERSFLYKEFAPLIGMIAGECATVGSNTVYKAISGHQISFYVFTFYTCLAAALVLLPFAIIFRRSPILPILSNLIVCFFSPLIFP